MDRRNLKQAPARRCRHAHRAPARRPVPPAAIGAVALLLAVLAVAFVVVPAVTGGTAEGPETEDAAQEEPASTEEAAEAETTAGEQASEEEAETVSSHVGELLQLPDYPSGCEPTSLTIVLRAMGFDVEIDDILEGYLTYDATWTDASSFLGDPYTGGGAFPPAIVSAANGFLASAGVHAVATDLTGSDFDDVAGIVSSGTPVLVWTTMYQQAPAFSGQTIDGYSWYTNEHCVVVYGVEEDAVLVSDPLEGLVERPRGAFERLFDECGRMAVCIDETDA